MAVNGNVILTLEMEVPVEDSNEEPTTQDVAK